ncbi:MAG: lipopolysaccharide biosynthesis protein [Candidatus Kryptoniota bacterium]
MEKASVTSLTEQAGLVSIAKLVSVFGMALTSIVLTRALSQSEYGNYEQVWLVYNSLVPLFVYGLGSALYYYSSRVDLKIVISASIVLSCLIGFVTGAVMLVFALPIAFFFNAPQIAIYLRVFSFYALLSSPSLLLESVLITEKKVRLLLFINGVIAIAIVTAVTVGAVVVKSMNSIFVFITIVGFIKSLFLIFFLGNRQMLILSGIGTNLKSQAVYALPVVISSIVGMISRQVDKYLVTASFSSSIYAVYAIGAKEIPLIAIVTGSASTVLFPKLSELSLKNQKDNFVGFWKNSISKTGLFLLPISFFLFAFASDFMGFFFGQKYLSSAGVFRIFLLMMPVRLAFYSQALFSLGKQKLYMYTSIADMFLSGLASYILMRLIGIEGAALGKVVVTYIEILFLAWILISSLGTTVRDFFPWNTLLRVSVISVACLIPAYVVNYAIQNVYFRFPLTGVIFVSLFVVISRQTKLVQIKDLRHLKFVVN